MSMFPVKKSLCTVAILRDLPEQFDLEYNLGAFRSKRFERSEINKNSFANYVDIISGDSEPHEQFFDCRDLQSVLSRVSCSIRARRRFGKIYASNGDLDKITPVKRRQRPEDMNLSVHQLQELLLVDDFPTFEPLLLKEEDEYDLEKVRLRVTEHKKLLRITIAYTLAFFILAIVTFYIIYYA